MREKWSVFVILAPILTATAQTWVVWVSLNWYGTLLAMTTWLIMAALSIREFHRRTAQDRLDTWFRLGFDLVVSSSAASEDDIIVRASAGWEASTGHLQEDLVDHRWSDFVHPEDKATILNATGKGISDSAPYLFYRWRHKQPQDNGELRWVWLEGKILSENGIVFTVARPAPFSTGHGATLALWSEVSSDIMVVTRLIEDSNFADRRIEWVNDTWGRSLSGSLADIYGTPLLDWVHPDDRLLAINSPTLKAPVVYRLQAHGDPDDFPQYRWFTWRTKVRQGKVYESGRDITEDLQRQARMNQAIRDLENSNTDLERFASAAAHQLRSPPRTILGMTHVLKEDYAHKLDETGRIFIQDIEDSAEQMSEIVNGLYRFSNARIGGDLSCQPVDLNAICASLWASKQKQNFSLDEDHTLILGELPVVTGDPVLLQEALANLIENGFKFNNSAVKTVSITAEQRPDGRWDIHVTDNGIGVAPKYHKKLFQIFQRVHPTYQGTGVGLALVKAIIQKFGGNIHIQSDVDKGATFTFDLPAS